MPLLYALGDPLILDYQVIVTTKSTLSWVREDQLFNPSNMTHVNRILVKNPMWNPHPQGPLWYLQQHQLQLLICDDESKEVGSHHSLVLINLCVVFYVQNHLEEAHSYRMFEFQRNNQRGGHEMKEKICTHYQ